MPDDPQTAERTSKLRSKWLWLGLPLAIVGIASVATWVTYARYTDPERVRSIAESYLQQLTLGRVSVGSADYSWSGGIHLRDVTVLEPLDDTAAQAGLHDDSRSEPVFSCRRVDLTHDLAWAESGRLQIKSIAAESPTCVIVRDSADGGTNLHGLFRRTESFDTELRYPLPTIELIDARVKVIQRESEIDRVVDDLTLTVRARPSRRDRGVYDVVWNGGGRRNAEGHSEVDTVAGCVRNIRGGLPWMSIEAVMIAINAGFDTAGTWSDLLGLDGVVRARDYNLGGDSGGPRSATIELDNAGLSIPINEQEHQLPPDHRYLRFERVFGTATLTASGIDARFTGRFHGSLCNVSATISGGDERFPTLDDIGFSVRLSIEDLELPRNDSAALPEHARFIERWPALAKFFRRYDPHGRVDVEIEAEKRAGPDEPVVARRVLVTARGCDASYHKLPYRVVDMSGSVEFTPDGATIRNISGEHDGGVVTVDGSVTGYGQQAAAELNITGTEIVIDDALIQTAPARFRDFHDRFDPKGALGISVDLTRPAGTAEQAAPWKTVTTLSFEDLSACYSEFPYPLEGLSGSVALDGPHVRISNVKGAAGGAGVEIDGSVALDAGVPVALDLTVRARGVSLDDQFVECLPATMQEQVGRFRPTGRFDTVTVLGLDPSHRTVTQTSDVTLLGVTIEPEAFPLRIEGVEGRLRFDSNRILLNELSGRYGEAALSATGTLDRTQPPLDTAVAIEARGVTIDDRLVSVVPERARQALTAWQVEGPIDADISVQSAPGDIDATLAVRTIARLHGATVRHNRLPLPLTGVTAEIVVDEHGVRMSGARGRFGDAELEADFEATFAGAGESGDITLTVRDLPLDDSVRTVLPTGSRVTWDRLGVAGKANVGFARVHFERAHPEASPVWSFAGHADLASVALTGVAGIREIDGTINGEGQLIDRLAGTTLAGTFELDTLRVLGRKVTAVAGPWAYARRADGLGRLTLSDIGGDIYGGALTARVDVSFDEHQTDYQLKTVLHNVDVKPFLNDSGSPASAETEPIEAKGVADLRLHLSGVAGDSKSRRGGGQIEIVEGQMYRLPIILAILQVINLAVPNEDAFHTVEAGFFLTGNQLDLKRVVLEGNALALAGYGTMSLPDQGLDLHLVSASPHDWVRGSGLADLVENASRELVELHVTGPLSQPTVRPVPLRRLTEEFARLFQKKKPKKMQTAAP